MRNDAHEFGLRTLLGEKATLLEAPQPLEDAIVVHGDPTRFGAFTEIPQLRSAVALMDAWDGQHTTARAWSPAGTTNPFELFATREQLGTLYEAGCTIVLEDVERFVVALRPLCRRLEADLGVAPGKVNVQAFCALRGGHGRGHFDTSFTLNCQLSGTKLWRLARNPALRFPPAGVGMFLGRPPECELDELLTGALPTSLEGGEKFVAEPGSVVFLPPGVLHETRMKTPSFAIGFAIEATDSVASQVAARVKQELQRIPELRAARLGPQARALRAEAASVAAELRSLADSLDAGQDPWWTLAAERVRIRTGLSAKVLSDTSIALSSAKTARTLDLAPTMVRLLGWASTRQDFSLRDLAIELGEIEPVLAAGCVRQLLFSGLMEKVQ